MAMFAKSTKLIALFSGLGVAIPVLSGLGAAFMRTRQASKEAEEGIESFADKLKSALDKTRSLKQELLLLNSSFKTPEEFTLGESLESAKTALALAVKANNLSKGSNDARTAGRSDINEAAVTTATELLRIAQERYDLHVASANALASEVTARERDASVSKQVQAQKLANFIAARDAARDLANAQAESQEAFDKQLYAQLKHKIMNLF